jgi:hypothetical protein
MKRLPDVFLTFKKWCIEIVGTVLPNFSPAAIYYVAELCEVIRTPQVPQGPELWVTWKWHSSWHGVAVDQIIHFCHIGSLSYTGFGGSRARLAFAARETVSPVADTNTKLLDVACVGHRSARRKTDTLQVERCRYGGRRLRLFLVSDSRPRTTTEEQDCYETERR